MNIVLYTKSFLPTIGGRELVVHYLARTLTQLGHKVRVVGPAGCWSRRKIAFPYPLHRWPSPRGLLKEQVNFLQLLIDTTIWGCDVIHAHSTYITGYIAVLLKSIKRVPVVVTPHGEDIHLIPSLGHGLRLESRLASKIRFTLTKADLITAISTSIENSSLNGGAPAEKLRRVPNGVDVARFLQNIEIDVRERLELASDSRLIVTVGNYRPCKGHEVLLRAMPSVLAAEPRAHLVVVGRHRNQLQPLLEELGLNEKVTLTGSIEFPRNILMEDRERPLHHQDLLAAIYQSSEVYVSSGIDEEAEGLSLAVLEALAAGLPVVATNISGNQDIIQEGENGFLVPPADPAQLAGAVVRILRDKELPTFMSSNAKMVARKYHWEEVARQYLTIYREAQISCRA